MAYDVCFFGRLFGGLLWMLEFYPGDLPGVVLLVFRQAGLGISGETDRFADEAAFTERVVPRYLPLQRDMWRHEDPNLLGTSSFALK